jgi:hypothetical protein
MRRAITEVQNSDHNPDTLAMKDAFTSFQTINAHGAASDTSRQLNQITDSIRMQQESLSAVARRVEEQSRTQTEIMTIIRDLLKK